MPQQVDQMLLKHTAVTIPAHGDLKLFRSPFMSVAPPGPHCSPLFFRAGQRSCQTDSNRSSFAPEKSVTYWGPVSSALQAKRVYLVAGAAPRLRVPSLPFRLERGYPRFRGTEIRGRRKNRWARRKAGPSASTCPAVRRPQHVTWVVILWLSRKWFLRCFQILENIIR